MPSAAPSIPNALGSGTREDRLGFRQVVGILWRCVALLRPVRWHIVALCAGYAIAAVISLPLILLLFDMFWTRALQGTPIDPTAAVQWGLDPAVASHVEILGDDLRRQIARTAIGLGFAIGSVLIPGVLALTYYQVWILQRVNQVLRLDLIGRLQTLSLRFHAEHRVGDAIYRLYQDSAMVTQLIEVLFLTPLFSTARFLAMLALVAAFDPALAGILLLVWVPAIALGAYFSRPLRVGFRAAREANSALTSRIQETLVGLRVIKAYGAEAREQDRFEAGSRAAFDAAFDARSRLARFGVGIFWAIGAALLVITALATLDTAAGEPLAVAATLAAVGLGAWNLGLYNAFKFLSGSGTDQVRLLFRTWGRTQDIAIGLDRVFELLDLEPEVQDAPDAVDLPAVREGITLRGVHFRYQPERPALEAVDLSIHPGEVMAIVGPTGAGKSTLVAMMLRLFDPQQGSIEIDGHDLRSVKIASLRRRVGIALQENLLFGTTIRENIRYAVPDADDAAVRAAAAVACADGFIEALPRGYDTPLGERGAKLSSGQRQRLSIARAILKDPDVLILDEPTASLDAETEREVLDRLTVWGRERTILLVTHRLSTIRRADRIAVLEGGRLVELGPHEALMTRPGGAYRSLVECEVGAPPAREAAGA